MVRAKLQVISGEFQIVGKCAKPKRFDDAIVR